ncbi:MAG TPA: hypothetical protein VF135_05740 [Terriglobales bacterium]
MKGVLRTFALVGVLAAALPLFAQKSFAPSPSITSGTYMGYPAASILTPNNMRLGDSAPRIRPTGPFGTGAFAGHPVVMGQKSIAPQRDHRRRSGGCRNCGGYSYFPIYYYDPYGYGYSAPVVVEDNSSLPNAGTFNSEQPEYSPNTRTENSREEQGGRFYERTITERSSEPLPPVDTTRTESNPAVTANGNENLEEPVRTLLIFKDGHRLEIANYAIMGSTLYVFAGDHRKIPLVDLDLDATQKANEDRGTDFRLPVAQKPS